MFHSIAGNYLSDVQPAADDVMGQGNIGSAASKLPQGGTENASGIEDATLGTAADAVKAIFATIAAPIQALIQHNAGSAPSVKIASAPPSPIVEQAKSAIASWAKSNPDIAKALGDAFTVGTAAAGSGALDTSVSDAASAVKNSVVDTATGIKNAVVGTPEEQAAAQTAKQTQASIDAVNPNLKNTKLVAGLKQTVTGQREITPASIFREEGITPDQQTVNLGTRLSDLPLGKSPSQNLTVLGKALTDTESKLTTALRGDPEINYNADKPTLLENLDAAKTQMPRETAAIKDSKSVFNNVIDFAKEKVAEADDSITGIRSARTAFDNRAKIEYPSAFKNGAIDTKTPAGQAIKTARDLINEHLYNTAPNGSEIQNLIGREADIFRATDNIAPKALSAQGKTLLEQQIANHPTLARYLGYGLGAVGADKIIKGVTGVGI